MYLPSSFRVDDPKLLVDFMQKHSFATIVSSNERGPQATHMPVLFEAGRGQHGLLVSHMARANPQWHDFKEEDEVLVIFTGPHAYISPSWYSTHPSVPTWNYTAVHAYGKARLVQDQSRFEKILFDLVEYYESGRTDRWDGVIPDEYREHMMKSIVGIEIEITRLEGKFKLSQNRPSDIQQVIDGLSRSSVAGDSELAVMMTKHSVK